MDKPIITFNETDIQMPQSGSTVEVTVYYDNVRSVNDPMSTVFGVSLTVVSEVDTETGKEIKYLISVPYTEMERSFAVIFSAIGVEGSSCTATLPIIQLGSASSVTLEPVIGVYPASGEYRTNAIKAVFQNTNGAHVTDVRVYSYTSKGMVLDITNKSEAWIKCYLNTAGGDDTRYEYYDVKVKSWEGTEPHYGEIVLTYKDTNGQTHLATYTVVQEAMDAGVDELDPEIQPYVTNLRVTAKGTNAQQSNMNYINVMYQDFRTGLVFNPISGAMWFKIVRQEEVERTENDVLIRYYWTADENTDTKARTTSVLFSGTAEGKALRTSVSVIQAKAGKEEEERPTDIPVIEGTYIGPIWKDVEFDFGNVEKVGYTIYYGDELIFKGKSWRRPNMTNNKIMVNKICQNYLVQTYLDLEKVSWEINNKDFTLRSEDGSIICHTYRFVNDWSYSDDFRAGLLSRPILNNQRAVRGQMFPFSVLGAGKQVSVEYGIDYIDGYTDEFGIPIQDWWNTEYVTNGVSTEFFSTARKNADYINKVWIGESEYSLEDKCFIPYVIYYNNPWGGFDWFPIGGKVTVKDKVTPYTYTKNYNNTTLEFGRCRYLSEIDRTYTVNTGWLKQEESDRMWYLLQSNIVYLHDIKADKIYPVTISDTEIEHKQKTRTEKIINYTFNLQLSHTRERL